MTNSTMLPSLLRTHADRFLDIGPVGGNRCRPSSVARRIQREPFHSKVPKAEEKNVDGRARSPRVQINAYRRPMHRWIKLYVELLCKPCNRCGAICEEQIVWRRSKVPRTNNVHKYYVDGQQIKLCRFHFWLHSTRYCYRVMNEQESEARETLLVDPEMDSLSRGSVQPAIAIHLPPRLLKTE